jgi:hypothetical protein
MEAFSDVGVPSIDCNVPPTTTSAANAGRGSSEGYVRLVPLATKLQ